MGRCTEAHKLAGIGAGTEISHLHRVCWRLVCLLLLHRCRGLLLNWLAGGLALLLALVGALLRLLLGLLLGARILKIVVFKIPHRIVRSNLRRNFAEYACFFLPRCLLSILSLIYRYCLCVPGQRKVQSLSSLSSSCTLSSLSTLFSFATFAFTIDHRLCPQRWAIPISGITKGACRSTVPQNFYKLPFNTWQVFWHWGMHCCCCCWGACWIGMEIWMHCWKSDLDYFEILSNFIQQCIENRSSAAVAQAGLGTVAGIAGMKTFMRVSIKLTASTCWHWSCWGACVAGCCWTWQVWVHSDWQFCWQFWDWLGAHCCWQLCWQAGAHWVAWI